MRRQKADPNILVISDLHLGEDLRPSGTAVSYLRRIAKLERELEAFLVHYTTERHEGRPWRLIVNGDMVDFMAMMILPPGQTPPGEAPREGTSAAGGEGSAASGTLGAAAADVERGEERAEERAEERVEEQRFGLGYAERQTLHKLDRVVDRHPGVFRRLAEFVRAGNELVVVVGNHDVEFHYPAVQQRFVAHLETLAAARLVGQIRFCPWFYYEEELVYVEHGHQYDEYCSFDYQLHPVEASGHVVPSIAHAGIRYFANLVPSVELSAGERFGLVDWLRWALAQGRRSLANIAVIYLSMVWRMISLSSRLCDPGRDAPRRERHRDALHALALGYRLAVDKVEALDRLRCLPAARRVLKILSAFFLDRLVLVAFAAVAVVGTVCLAPGYWKPGGAFALVLGAFVANAALSRGRGLASPLALRRAPELIGRILRAPFIVFGHSHRAERLALPGGSVYFNTGSWADEDVRHAFTHLVITGDEPCAELRQWRDGRSAPFSPLPDDDDEAKAPAAVAAASVSSVA